MNEWWQTRRFRLGVTVGAATLIAVLAGQALTRPYLIEAWIDGERAKLRQDPDAAKASHVRRWARLGDSGLLALTDLLVEEDPAIRQAARTALRNEWNSWRLLEDEERDRRTLLALERCIDREADLGAEEAELLSEWATETLSRRIDSSRSGRMTLACQEALACAGPPKGTLPPLDATLAVSDALGGPATSGDRVGALPAELIQPASFSTSDPSGLSGIRNAGLDLPALR